MRGGRAGRRPPFFTRVAVVFVRSAQASGSHRAVPRRIAARDGAMVFCARRRLKAWPRGLENEKGRREGSRPAPPSR